MEQGDDRPVAGRGHGRARSLLPAGLKEVWSEVRAALARRRQAAAVARRNAEAIARLLAGAGCISLELGAGTNRLDGWTSIDANGACDLCLDLAEPLPFPDGSVAAIYSSHMLEHFLYPQPMLGLLRECHRVLVPGGWISIAVPDAAIYLRAYFHPEEFDAARYCLDITGLSYRSKIDFVNYMAHMAGTHRHLFDQAALLAVLAEAGFAEVRAREFDPALDLDWRRYETIYARGER
jgi:predicted SAM-dependent methyltransferase